MTNAEVANKIIELCGGKDNFVSVENCMTRLRIKFNNKNLIQIDELKKVPGILGINDADTFQIVVGPGKSTKIHEAIIDVLGQEWVLRKNSEFKVLKKLWIKPFKKQNLRREVILVVE